MIRILAILCIRDEAIHMRRCLDHLVASHLDVFLIDNGSSDGSRGIASEYLGNGVVAIEELAWGGTFSLSDQLNAKRRIAADCDYDWIVHVDADEWLCPPNKGQSLHDAIAQADAAGYNCINFHEIVFVPLPDEDFFQPHYELEMRHYYFYQPRYPRLQRAWKRCSGLDSTLTGGHLLAGSDLKLYPTDFFLRHYIALSERHARAKYVARTFSSVDLDKGWHANRLAIRPENLRVKSVPGLWRMKDPMDTDFNLSIPMNRHFWAW
ncbi:MAG TPA: glycosyltransferase family 2 protein [Opitutaceae bacterium]